MNYGIDTAVYVYGQLAVAIVVLLLALAVLAGVGYFVALNWPVLRAWVRDSWAARRIQKGAAALAFVLLGAGTSHAQEEPEVNLYAGRLITVNLNDAGGISRGDDMYVLRMVAVAPGPFGVRLGFRGDLTALGYLDPSSLDLESARSAEGYAAASWSTNALGLQVGPAVFAGALLAIQDGAVDWRMKGGWGGGVRLGYARSWAYVTVGQDAASDSAAALGNSPFRLIVPFSVEAWRIAVQGEFISGAGGRFRAAAVVRLPNPWSE